MLDEPSVFALLAAALFNVGLSAWMLTRRARTAAWPLATMTFATALWQVTYAFELIGAPSGGGLGWVKYQHVGIAALPVAWFVFAVRYVGASRLLSKRTWTLLLALPVTHLSLAFTNDWHHQVWREWTLVREPFPIYSFEYGSWFWFYAVCSHALILGSSLLLAWPHSGRRGIYARQGRFLAAMALAPWLANAAYLLRLGPVENLDLTPFGFTLASAVFALSVARLRLLDLVPVARSAVVEGMSDGVVAIDDQGRIVDVNPAAARLLGVDAAAALGRPAHEGLGAWGGLAASPDSERPAELTLGTGDTSRTLEQRVAPLRDARGRVTGSLVVFVDVTVRKRWEAQLEAANRQLAAALEESKRLAVGAEAASRAKAAFVANVSHEMRTPLHGIIGSAELLLGPELRDQQRELVELIHGSGLDLLGVVSDVLDFSQVDSGRIELERRAVDLRDLIEERLEKVAVVARGKRLSLDYEIAEGIPKGVLADHARLGQVLDILLSNAVKFTQRGWVKVSVDVEAGAPAPAQLRFVVSDTGVGLDPEALAGLFEPFTRADLTTTRRFGGTGLGLSIARRLCELMGGRIAAARSERGARLVFSLPLAAARLPPAAHREEDQPQLQGRSIWIVHPRAALRRHLALAVRAWGLVVSEAASHAEAVVPPGLELLLVDEGLADAAAEAAARAGARPRVVAIRALGRQTLASRADAAVAEPVRWSRLYNALLPVAAGATRQPAPRATDFAAPSRSRVLLAEDNAATRKVLVTQLARLGVDVDPVTDGPGAVEAAQRLSYDLLLLDVQMPELDGLDAARGIRTLQLSPRPWIVALSASASADERRRCIDAGIDVLYAKPTRLATLRHILDSRPGRVGGVSGGAEPVDWSALRELHAADPANLTAVAEAFSRGAASLVPALHEARRTGDRAGLELAAGELARHGVEIGARRLAAVCRSLVEGDLEAETPVTLLLDDVETELERISGAFRRVSRGDTPV